MVYCGIYPVDRKWIWAFKRCFRKIKIKWCSAKLWTWDISCPRIWI
jgi:hypothetical protein